MTERNNYCKKKTAEYTDFELAIVRAIIGTFESESQARLGTLGKTSRVLELGHWETSRAVELGHWETSRAVELGHWETSRVLELGRSETADRALE